MRGKKEYDKITLNNGKEVFVEIVACPVLTKSPCFFCDFHEGEVCTVRRLSNERVCSLIKGIYLKKVNPIEILLEELTDE